MKVKEFYIDKSKWAQHTTTRGDARCLISAVCLCYGPHDAGPVLDAIRKYLTEKRLKNNYTISCWNDEPDRTFDDIVKLVTDLDI